MRRPALVIIFIFITIIGLAVGQASMSNQLSTTGAALAAVQAELDEYKRQNTILQEQLLQASSLTNLSKKAETLGFVEANTQVYLTNPVPLALKQ